MLNPFQDQSSSTSHHRTEAGFQVHRHETDQLTLSHCWMFATLSLRRLHYVVIMKDWMSCMGMLKAQLTDHRQSIHILSRSCRQHDSPRWEEHLDGGYRPLCLYNCEKNIFNWRTLWNFLYWTLRGYSRVNSTQLGLTLMCSPFRWILEMNVV